MRVFAFPLGLEPAPLGAVEEREVCAAAFNPKTANKEAGGSGRRAVSRPQSVTPSVSDTGVRLAVRKT